MARRYSKKASSRRRARDEEAQGWHAEERPLGQEGQEPQTGDCDRTVGGEGQGQEGAEEGFEEAEGFEEKDGEEVEAEGKEVVPSSLRAKRSNPESRRGSGLLRRFAPRNDGGDSPRLALPRRRPVRLLCRPACRRPPRRRRRRPPFRRRLALQARLQRIHQVDDVVRLFLALGDLDRLAGGLAAHQRLQRVLIFILELRGIEMRGLGVQDVAREFDHVLGDLRALDVRRKSRPRRAVRRDSAAWCRAGPCRAARSP